MTQLYRVHFRVVSNPVLHLSITAKVVEAAEWMHQTSMRCEEVEKCHSLGAKPNDNIDDAAFKLRLIPVLQQSTFPQVLILLPKLFCAW